MTDIDRYLSSTGKAELIEELSKRLDRCDNPKVVCIILEPEHGRNYTITPLLLGVASLYETIGIIKVAEHDILHTYEEEPDGSEELPE